MFSSETDEWPTPPELFAALNAEFGFTLDVCATAENAKCARYFTREDDGLLRPWAGTAWMNPPYGRAIGRWAAKAHASALDGATVVCLLPARCDAGWWHEHVMAAAELRLVKGRLSFSGSSQEERRAATGAHNAPFPSAVAVFRPGCPVNPPVLSAITRAGEPARRPAWVAEAMAGAA